MHIIGHSLGAQTAGYAGKSLSGVGWITGISILIIAFVINFNPIVGISDIGSHYQRRCPVRYSN